MRRVVITVGPMGAQASKADNPSLPTSREEVAEQVTAAYEAEAAVASIHLRDADGRPTADLAIARRTLDRIAERSPILVQLSTGVAPDAALEDRERLLELRPRMATLSPCSMSFGDGEFRNPPAFVRRLAGRMRELDTKPELEIYDSGHVEAALRLLDENLLVAPLQVGIVMGVRGGMAATPENLLATVAKLPEGTIWQAIAVGKANFTIGAMAIALGGNVRTGLEDNLYLRRGELADGHAPLVERFATIGRSLDREPASPAEAEQRLGQSPSPPRGPTSSCRTLTSSTSPSSERA